MVLEQGSWGPLQLETAIPLVNDCGEECGMRTQVEACGDYSHGNQGTAIFKHDIIFQDYYSLMNSVAPI